jgi:hypothetical protein
MNFDEKFSMKNLIVNKTSFTGLLSASKALMLLTLVVAACGKGGSKATSKIDPATGLPITNGINQTNNLEALTANPDNPPDINWYNHSFTGNRPPKYCAVTTTKPTSCTYSANGYTLCGDYWWFTWDSHYWAFAAYGACKKYDSGNQTLWTNANPAGTSKTFTINPPTEGRYFVTLSGTYAGYNKAHELLSVKINDKKERIVQDLDNSFAGVGGMKQSCLLGSLSMKAGTTYSFNVSTLEDPVNNVAIRLTSFRPANVYNYCY